MSILSFRRTVRLGLRWFAVTLFGAAFACASFAAAPAKKNPSWADLSAEQQQILKPLANDWNQLDGPRRTKWIGIAKRYPTMTQTGQKRVQKRMTEWVKLTPDERRKAREQYRRIGTLPPEKREVIAQQWQEYQKLPDDVKKKLAAEPQKKVEKIEPRKRTKTAKNSKPVAIPEPVPAPPSAEAPILSVPTSKN